MSAVRIYNTLSAQKEDFLPRGDPVRMYVCGVTPYDSSHVGHAMSYIIFDALRRYMEWRGYKVRHVQNFTDIDDKIIERAKRLSVSPHDLAERYIAEYFSVMDALNIQRAHVYPRATEEVPQILDIVRGLVDKGYAYASGGDVYFRVTQKSDYGKLSHRALDDMQAGARVEVGAAKEHPMDFTLWKAAKPGEPSWESPWGQGRPGWHIECSAMSLRYLGEQVDIHGGGQDLVFPHHENEIAQSEAFTGKTPFARYWVHNGLLQVSEDKMSKSLGNIVPVRDALARFSPDAMRLFVLSSHYHKPLTYDEAAIASMERGAARLRSAVEVPGSGAADALDPQPYRDRFTTSMDDDFNTPQAQAALFDLAREVNRARDAGVDVAQAQTALREMAGVLGLTLRPREGGDLLEAQPFIDLLVETRKGLRAARQYALADSIRDRLTELGVVLEDGPQGTLWKHKGP
ncbi:MAG: cysteine--tRNA ligase [Dehalococcoidia bacterium]|nr:cysteine--tRNA ligase [Dehalococcoidia bacterium]